ncbi:HAD hydrolase-like protein [Nocardia sp. NPDC048505]|uniref:HAD hydrolase-like protein n=1 Tax=unclassified Nocardia TaxID=2637762 RepID=UPI0033E56B2B
MPVRPAADRDCALLTDDPATRAVIMAIALHPAPASPAALAAATGLADEDLERRLRIIGAAALLDGAQGPAGAGRLCLDPRIRDYALRKLDAAARADLEARLVEFYRDFARTHADIHSGPRRIAALERERENILAFAEIAFRRADGPAVLDLAESLAGFLWGRGRWRELVRLGTRAAAVAPEPVARARMHALVGRVQAGRGRRAETLDCLARSEAALPPGATAAERRETLRLSAQFDSRFGEYATARADFAEVLAHAPDTAGLDGQAATLIELGLCALRESKHALAIETFQRARHRYERLGCAEGTAEALVYLADAWYESGAAARAQPLYQRGLLLTGWLDQPLGAGRCHLGLAKIAIGAGRPDRARRRAADARSCFARVGVADLIAEADLIARNLPVTPEPAAPPTIADLLRRCRAVLFDFDDTIAATIRTRWPALRATAATFGVLLEDETIRAAWGRPFHELIAAIVPAVDPVEFDRRYRRAMAERKSVPTVGAAQLLEALRRRGIRRLIVSSGCYEYVVQDLRQIGLDHYFAPADIYGAAETGAHKPDPAVLHRPIATLARAGIATEETLCVGDSHRDYAAAAGNGVQFLAVLTGAENHQDFRAAGLADRQIAGNLSLLRLWL